MVQYNRYYQEDFRVAYIAKFFPIYEVLNNNTLFFGCSKMRKRLSVVGAFFFFNLTFLS